MPSPYQRDLFRALHADGRMQIRVLYYTASATDRNWTPASLSAYEDILPGGTIGWLGTSAHLNPKVLNALKAQDYDVCVVGDYSAPTTQLAMRVLSFCNKPWVFWGELPGLNERGRLGSVVRDFLLRPVSKSAAAIAAIGSDACKAYATIAPNTLIMNIPYFCDLAAFRAAATRKEMRTKKTVDVLFSGQLIERKGVDLLLTAFAQAAAVIPNLHLQLLGTGPAAESLAKQADQDFRDRVHFLGFHQPEAIPDIFAAADIFVLPSRHDGWGVVVNEALGAGLPIIVSDRVGARDLVESGRNGFIIPAGDIAGLAGALVELGRSSNLRETFGRHSTTRSAQWDVDQGVRRWVELIDEVMMRRPQ